MPAPAATGAARADPRFTGRITVHPAGYGFVNTDDGETVFVPAKYRNHSLDGDRVVVDTWPGVRGTEGRVKEVLARGRARLTGILRRVGRAVYLEPDDPRIAADYGRVHLDDAPIGKDGDAIVVEITRYPDAARNEIAAKLLKVLGDPEDPRTEIEKILAVSMIPLEFPDDATAASGAHARGARRRRTSPIASICAAAGSRRSIRRPRATSTMRCASKMVRTAARACGSRSPTSRTTCAGTTRSIAKPRSAACRCTCRIA